MLLILGKPTYFGDAYDIDIMLLLKSSRLINSYPTPLPTFDKMGLAIYIQELKLKGKYDALIGDATTNENLQLWKFGKAKDTDAKNSTPKKAFWVGSSARINLFLLLFSLWLNNLLGNPLLDSLAQSGNTKAQFYFAQLCYKDSSTKQKRPVLDKERWV